MPGAPNRPPDPIAEIPGRPPIVETAEEKALRRLAPSRVALQLEIWKNNPPTDIVQPFDRAEEAFGRGDFDAALNALDQLSIRFAEPRWPSLPGAFGDLKVAIPAPMPPQWDPAFSLTPDQREMRRAQTRALSQVGLAEGSLEWAERHHVDLGDAPDRVRRANTELRTNGVTPAFYAELDALWRKVRETVPAPKGPVARVAVTAAPFDSERA